jgi:hypothetical protein
MQVTAVNDPFNPESKFKRSIEDSPAAYPQMQPRFVSSQRFDIEIRITRCELTKSLSQPIQGPSWPDIP